MQGRGHYPHERIIAALLPLGSLGLLLGAATIADKLDSATFFARLTSPPAVFLVILLSAIFLPAYRRIYLVLLLKVTGVFTASERRAYQAAKERWKGYLWRGAVGGRCIDCGGRSLAEMALKASLRAQGSHPGGLPWMKGGG
jgi:hypothetical protein